MGQRYGAVLPCIYAFIWVGVGRGQEVRSKTLILSKHMSVCTPPQHLCVYRCTGVLQLQHTATFVWTTGAGYGAANDYFLWQYL